METSAQDNYGRATTSTRTRTIVISGLLGAVQIVLGLTGLGFIPLPTGVNATILHIPTVIAGCLEGPVAGVAVGLIFGIFSFVRSTSPAFADPVVAILPRLFPGLVAWVVFATLKRTNLAVAAAAAGILGTLTNTVLVLTIGTLRGYFTPEFAWTVAFTNAPGEVIVAAIITTAVVLAVAGRGRKRASSV
ncbi:MAG: ECF transporter S component [Chloroflexi bacterium]|nr:ECF transporter S component [Chloroflexota bacterium]